MQQWKREDEEGHESKVITALFMLSDFVGCGLIVFGRIWAVSFQ